MRADFRAVAGALVLGLAGCFASPASPPVESGVCTTCKKSSTARTVASSSSASTTASSAPSSSGSSATASASGSSTSSSTSSSISSSTSSSSTSSSSAGTSSSGSSGGSSSSSGGSSSACSSLQAAGGPCASLIDCQAGLACTGETCPQTNVCNAGVCFDGGPRPSMACTADGKACTASEACCGGNCTGGVCVPWSRCSINNEGCTTSADCCDGFACSGSPGGVCQPACGGLFASCQVNSECCGDQGLMCTLIVQLSLSACVPGAGNQPLTGSGTTAQVVPCGSHCSTYECQLGAACQPLPDGGDPCAAAGLVCDLGTQVCRDPIIFETCAPGGPPCEPYPQSTAAIQCVDVPGNGGLCLQACSQTSDCINATTNCFTGYAAQMGGGFCNGNQCSTDFSRCPAQGVSDGICEPQGAGYKFCQQESADGGTAGQACDLYNNRQRGQFCAFPNICPAGICAPVCNAGTTGVPACPAGTVCLPALGMSSDPSDLGICSVACDFTALDGGGCTPVAGGPPQKCLPQILLTYQDSPQGYCAAAIAAPVALGQPCGAAPGGVDACAPGLLCLQPSAVQNSRCFQLCNLVSSSKGTGGCSATQTCTALDVGFTQPTNTGYCQ